MNPGPLITKPVFFFFTDPGHIECRVQQTMGTGFEGVGGKGTVPLSFSFLKYSVAKAVVGRADH